MKYNYKTKPFEHQRTALKQGAESQNFAYFMEMGTGKTKVTIDNAAYLFTQNKKQALQKIENIKKNEKLNVLLTSKMFIVDF